MLCQDIGHYNLLFREEEREMVPYCKDANVALTPYSALAAGRLSKNRQQTSERLEKSDCMIYFYFFIIPTNACGAYFSSK